MTGHRFERRRERIRAGLVERKVEGLLVTKPANVSYLSGFSGDSTVLIVGTARDLLVSDFRFDTQLRDECPGLERHIRPSGTTLPSEIGAVLGRLGMARVGFEASVLTVAAWEEIRSAAGSVELVATTDVVETLRSVKDQEELDAIRRAIEIAERAFDALRGRLGDLDDEKAAADALEFELRGFGADGSAFPPIVAAGPRSALPHARPIPGARLDGLEFVLVDWGACLGPLPYRSDLTRVVAIGIVSSKFEEVYRVVLEAQRRAFEVIRPGVACAEVDAAARSAIAEAGFGRFFDHGLGHGIGLEVHERPGLRVGATEILEAGMVLTIEPGIYLPDWGGIRIEDDVLVTSEGAEFLTKLPRDLDAVRDG